MQNLQQSNNQRDFSFSIYNKNKTSHDVVKKNLSTYKFSHVLEKLGNHESLGGKRVRGQGYTNNTEGCPTQKHYAQTRINMGVRMAMSARFILLKGDTLRGKFPQDDLARRPTL